MRIMHQQGVINLQSTSEKYRLGITDESRTNQKGGKTGRGCPWEGLKCGLCSGPGSHLVGEVGGNGVCYA